MSSPAVPAIVATDLRHAYGHGSAAREVLRSVDLEVRRGEVVLVCGDSGAGKTTLLTLCGALRSMQHGHLAVLGRDLAAPSSHAPALLRALRSEIGFVFQGHHLIDALTAGQNVMLSLLGSLPPAEAAARAFEALERLDMQRHVDALPERLSGGERQRVAVARALVRRPALILADEPTAALDDRSAASVAGALQAAATSMHSAVLLVTHDARLWSIADRVLRLVDGRLVDGRPARAAVTAPTGVADEACA